MIFYSPNFRKQIRFILRVMNKKKYLVIASIAILICCGGFYFYNNVLYKEARNIEKEIPSYSLTPSKLINEYKSNISESDSKYLNKTIQVEGEITEVSDSILTLDSSIFCAFDKKINKASIGNKVIIKGRCIGFDELMEEIKLDQCSIIQ